MFFFIIIQLKETKYISPPSFENLIDHEVLVV